MAQIDLSKLGVLRKEGSSIDAGIPYQDIPQLGIPGHRGNSEWRAERVMELVPLDNKEVYDLGCSVGSMSYFFSKEAKRVIGFDHDEESIKVAQSLYNSNTEFKTIDLNRDFLNSFDHTDVIVWTSQFMWMVKQHGMDYALDFLWSLSQKCDVLIFETAGRGDGSAPINVKQEEIHRMLCKNTCFQEITDHGPWNDGWTPRNVFVCKKPFRGHKTHWSSIDLVERGLIKKSFIDHPYAKELFSRESDSLWKLSQYRYFPKVHSMSEREIVMSYEGPLAKWIPDNDLEMIVGCLKAQQIIHRDIRPDNILWNGKNVVLIDFAFSSIGDEITNYHYDLGGKYKCPNGFNDEYSLRKIQKELLN